MRKLILIISGLVIVIAGLAGGGIYFYSNYDSGEQIIFVEAAENPNAPVDVYVPLTDQQMKTIKKRVEKNMLRVADNGEPLTEVEAREILNYVVAVAVKRFDVRIEAMLITPGFREMFGAEAMCVPSYDQENKIAAQPVAVDRAAYDNAKSSIRSLIRLLFILTHEVGHGVEPDTANDPASLMGLVFNMYYDAKKVIPEYIEDQQKSRIHEMAADIFSCSVMLEEFKFILENVQDETINVSFDWHYSDLFKNRTENILMAVLPGMDEVYDTYPLLETPMVTPVTDAYAGGKIEPNPALAYLFDRGGAYGVPGFGEFIKLMDETFGIGKINARLKDEELNGRSVKALKQFVLCAPFIIGVEDVPYESYGKYLTDLHGQREDYTRVLDMDRVWAPEWVAEMSNGEFAKIVEPYLKTGGK